MRLYCIAGLLLLCSKGFGQLQYAPLTTQAACQQAAVENKLVMIVIHSKTCEQCNQVAFTGLQTAAASQLQELVIPIIITPDSAEYSTIVSRYLPTQRSFGVLYLNARQELVHFWNKSTTHTQSYIDETWLAIRKQNGGLDQLDQLSKKLAATPADDSTAIKLYQLRATLHLDAANRRMANEYARAVVPAWKDSFAIISTLIQLRPTLGSFADSIMRQVNLTLFWRAWQRLPLPMRNTINAEIIGHTMSKAISTKDKYLADRCARFAASMKASGSSDSRQHTYTLVMAQFTKQTADTTAYLKHMETAMNFYLRMNPDSLAAVDKKVMDSLLTKKLKDKSNIRRHGDTLQFSVMRVSQSYLHGSSIERFCSDVYAMRPYSEQSEMAIGWAAHGLKLMASPALLHTYAKLLYIHGRQQEAIAAQKKATEIAMNSSSNMAGPRYSSILHDMQAGRPLQE